MGVLFVYVNGAVVYGTVTDQDGFAIQNATVDLSGFTATTDAAGFYKVDLSGVTDAGFTGTLSVILPDFSRVTKDISLDRGTALQKNITLTKEKKLAAISENTRDIDEPFVASRNTVVQRQQNLKTLINAAQTEYSSNAVKIATTIYKETLREMIHLFGNLSYVNSENKITKVRSIHANPERTIAKLAQENNIILPIISVNQTTTDDDRKRQRYDSIMAHEVVWNDKKQRAQRVISFAPKPVNLIYSVNVWTKYKEDMDQLVEQIRGKFNPSLTVPTKNNSVTNAFLLEETDDGLVEPGEREDRIIRRSFTISIETYLPATRFLYTNTGRLELFMTEVGIDES